MGRAFGTKETLYATYEVMKQHRSLGEILLVPNTYNIGFEARRGESSSYGKKQEGHILDLESQASLHLHP